MTKRTAMTALCGMVLVLGACSSGGSSGGSAGGSGSTTISRAANPRVETAVRIARAVEANPDRAEQVLRENGMTADEYEDLMYDIAADPAMSEEFTQRIGG